MPIRNFESLSAGDPLDDFFTEGRLHALDDMARAGITPDSVKGGPGVMIGRSGSGVRIRMKNKVMANSGLTPFQLQVGRGGGATWIYFTAGRVAARFLTVDYAADPVVKFEGQPIGDPSAAMTIGGGLNYLAYLRAEFEPQSINFSTSGDFWITDFMALASVSMILAEVSDVPLPAPAEIDRATGIYESRDVDGIETANGVFFCPVAKFATSGSGDEVQVAQEAQYVQSNQYCVNTIFENVIFIPQGVGTFAY